MESFGVDSYFRLASDNSLVKNSNPACWAGIDNVRCIQILASLPNYKALIDQRNEAGKPFKSSFIKPYLYIASLEELELFSKNIVKYINEYKENKEINSLQADD